jgi:hypothetical protein
MKNHFAWFCGLSGDLSKTERGLARHLLRDVQAEFPQRRACDLLGD